MLPVSRHSYARVEGEHAGDTALADTLIALAERMADALDCFECCIYEHLEAEDSIRCQAIWSRELSERDKEWVGQVKDLSHLPGLGAAVHGGKPFVHYPEADQQTVGAERMGYWGELAALYAPILDGSQVLGVVELTEKRTRREFSDDDRRLAQRMAGLGAVALRTARDSRRHETTSRRLAALLKASRAITSTVVFEEVLQQVAQQAAAAVDVPTCYIYEYEGLGDRIVWRSQFQRDSAQPLPQPVGTTYQLDDQPWNRAALLDGSPVHATLQDAGLDERRRAVMAAWNAESVLTVPLVFGDESMGIMELVESSYPRRFSGDEIELARAIGEQAAVAIHNAHLYRRETWRTERLVRVLDISRAVGSSLDAAQVADGLRAQVGRLFMDKPLAVGVRLMRQRPDEEEPRSGDDLVELALRGSVPQQRAWGAAHRLVVPLVHKGAAVGYLEIVGGGPAGFARDEVELVQLLANQAAAAVDNARLYETIERQAITDGLTGIYNYRFFFRSLRAEVTRARRYGFALSVLMLDLDDFKSFNDRFGHPAGDQVLRSVACLLRDQVRSDIDVAARYGGEEFAVILPHTPRVGAETVGRRLNRALIADARSVADDGARLTGERVRQSIAAAPLPLLTDGLPAHVTVSVGVATLAADAVDADELVSHADKALYLAKQRGRDRVEVYTPESPKQ